MRWQRAARWIVAVAGLGVAVVLYTQTRERPAGRPAPGVPADPEVRAESSAGTVIRLSDGEQAFELTHEGERVFQDGRTEWTKASIKIGDDTFLAADVITSSAETVEGQPAELHLKGNVHLDTDGASVRSDEATYNRAGGIAIMPGHVEFTHGRISGSGTDGRYERDAGVFTLAANARVAMTTDSGETVNGAAEQMTYNRSTQALVLEGNARLDHVRQAMSAAGLTLHMTQDQDRIRVIELRTNARVDPRAGYESDAPAMRARDIDLTFREGTEQLERGVLVGGSSMTIVEATGRRTIDARDITFATATDGRTLTHLEGHGAVSVRTPASGDSPPRTVTAADLVATGQEGHGLTSAIFAGNVRFVEVIPAKGGQAGGERTGTGDRLTMMLGGQLEAVQRAHFEGNATFVDGEVTGNADLGDYDAAGGRLTLRPAASPRRLPRVESGTVTVDAATLIDVDLDSQDLHAVGDVRTVSLGENRSNRKTEASVGFFDKGSTMYGFGHEFSYVERTGEARYRGTAEAKARVTQGETTVTAVNIRLERETENLEAEAEVVSTFVTAGTAGEPPATHRVESETLVYTSETGQATYTGDPVVLTGPDGKTTAAHMVMTLARGTREMERLDAEGDVQSTLVDGSEALAQFLIYEAGPGRYTLRGEPLVLKTVDKEKGTCSETRGRLAYFTIGQPSPEFPAAENRGRVARRNIACDAQIER
jgi:lipopolysaccharide export system protein LptA